MKLPSWNAPFIGVVLILMWQTPASALGRLPLHVNAEQVANNDTLAWSLLGVLGVTLGLVGACGLGMYRQSRRTTPESELLEEIKREARLPGTVKLPAPPAASLRPEWERPADWWKNSSMD